MYYTAAGRSGIIHEAGVCTTSLLMFCITSLLVHSLHTLFKQSTGTRPRALHNKLRFSLAQKISNGREAQRRKSFPFSQLHSLRHTCTRTHTHQLNPALTPLNSKCRIRCSNSAILNTYQLRPNTGKLRSCSCTWNINVHSLF